MSAFGPIRALAGYTAMCGRAHGGCPRLKKAATANRFRSNTSEQKNPDWLFVLTGGSAIGQEGEAAKDVLDNPLVAATHRWKKGQVVYFLPENYLAAGGAQQLLNATAQVREAFEAAK